MITILEFVGVGGLGLVAGALIGVHNVPTVDKAIAAIKAAEGSAAATLAKITAHKAQPAPVVAAPVLVA